INSSTGIPNPPTSVYVMAIPFALNPNPMTAILFIMGLNVIGVGLLWLIAHRYFGRTVALAAGMSYALSPWAVLYSRKIWAQEFHTPFILLGLLMGLYGFWEAQQRSDIPKHPRWFDRHEWAQVLCLPVLLFGFQIHFASWALLPLYGVLVLYGWRRISWRAMAVSFVVSGLVSLPYVIGFWQTYQRNPGQVRPSAVSTLADTNSTFSTQSLEYLLYLATGFGLETWIAPQQQTEMLVAVPPVALWWIIGGTVIIGTAALWRKSLRRYALLLLIWVYLPALALVPQWAGVYLHYFIASIPALMLLAGIGVAWIAETVPLQPHGRSIILLAYGFILLTQGMYWRGVLRYVDNTEIRYPGFTVPLHYLQSVETALADFDDVVVLSDGMAWDLHHESAVWPVLLRDTAHCVRTLIGDGYAVFPAGEFAALQAPNMPQDGIGRLYQNANEQHFDERPGGLGYTVYRWEQAPEWDGAEITPIEPVRFAGDVLLTGYHLSDNLLLLEWRLPRRSPELNFQYSGQFIAEDGSKIGQRDTVFWQGRHWCENDRLLTWIWGDVPAETVALHVFLYELGDANEPPYINVPVLDAAGQPIGDHAEIDLGQ
ncbi:MAG: glycosyltransferase family 39 protein, partial [Acidobacteriales bacterium]|nr:glycosyltransferase family 39 protein [Terriglobales bacterium]